MELDPHAAGLVAGLVAERSDLKALAERDLSKRARLIAMIPRRPIAGNDLLAAGPSTSLVSRLLALPDATSRAEFVRSLSWQGQFNLYTLARETVRAALDGATVGDAMPQVARTASAVMGCVLLAWLRHSNPWKAPGPDDTSGVTFRDVVNDLAGICPITDADATSALMHALDVYRRSTCIRKQRLRRLNPDTFESTGISEAARHRIGEHSIRTMLPGGQWRADHQAVVERVAPWAARHAFDTATFLASIRVLASDAYPDDSDEAELSIMGMADFLKSACSTSGDDSLPTSQPVAIRDLLLISEATSRECGSGAHGALARVWLRLAKETGRFGDGIEALERLLASDRNASTDQGADRLEVLQKNRLEAVEFFVFSPEFRRALLTHATGLRAGSVRTSLLAIALSAAPNAHPSEMGWNVCERFLREDPPTPAATQERDWVVGGVLRFCRPRAGGAVPGAVMDAALGISPGDERALLPFASKAILLAQSVLDRSIRPSEIGNRSSQRLSLMQLLDVVKAFALASPTHAHAFAVRARSAVELARHEGQVSGDLAEAWIRDLKWLERALEANADRLYGRPSIEPHYW